MRDVYVSNDAYRILSRLKQGNIKHYDGTPGVREVLDLGLAYIDDRRLAITEEGRSVPRIMRKAG